MKYLLVLLMLFIGCTFEGKNMGKIHPITHKNNEMKKKIYFLNYDLRANGEVYFNGFLLSKIVDNEGLSGASVYLNPYLLSSGKQLLTVKLHTTLDQKMTIDFIQDIRFDINYSTNFSNTADDFNLELINQLQLPADYPLGDSIVYSWEFDAAIDFENNTLDNALNLSNAEISSLTKEVIEKYQEVHDILNAGNTKAFRALFEASLTRQANSMYYTEEETRSYVSEQLVRASKASGSMLPLANFFLVVHLNNKTVELINIEGNSALISTDMEGYMQTTYGLFLYKDKTTGELKVF